jgi:site-specific DNA recombinase
VREVAEELNVSERSAWRLIEDGVLPSYLFEGSRRVKMDPELFKEFCTEFIREVNRLRQDQAGQRAALDAELARVGRRIRKIVDAIADGVPARSLKDELLGLEAREDEIKVKLAATPEPKVYLAPNMAEIYRQRVSELQHVLAAGSEQAQALEAIRSLIDKIVLAPVEGVLRIDLHGEAAAILQFSAAGKKGRFQLGDAN